MTKKHMNKPIKPQKPSSKSLPPLEMIEVSYVIGIDNNREPILFNKRTHPHYYNNEESEECAYDFCYALLDIELSRENETFLFYKKIYDKIGNDFLICPSYDYDNYFECMIIAVKEKDPDYHKKIEDYNNRFEIYAKNLAIYEEKMKEYKESKIAEKKAKLVDQLENLNKV